MKEKHERIRNSRIKSRLKALLAILFVGMLTTQAQNIVSGVVRDDKGQSLPGVNVSLKGNKSVGAVTDINGFYSLTGYFKGGVLVFSFIGFEAQEIIINDQNVINVVLKTSSIEMSDVVVVGHGTQKKVSITGAISSIKAVEIQSASTPSMSNALSGRLPGLITRQSSGEPGYDAAAIYIRGRATWGNSNPLILVDGVERDINLVNTNEIESFSILKDASATAVYGVQGANGVILISTKKGKYSKPQVQLKSEFANNYPLRVPQYISGVEYAGLINEALERSGKADKYTPTQIENYRSGSDPYLYPNVNWLDVILRKYSAQTINNLNVSGGGERVRYFVNVGYTLQDGIYKDSPENEYKTNARLQRYSFRSNVDIDLTKNLELNLGIGGIIDDRRYPGNSSYAIFDAARNTSPIAFPIKNPDGSIGGSSTFAGNNPWGMSTQSGYSNDRRQTIQANFGLKWDLSKYITKGLTLSGRFAYDLFYMSQIIRFKEYEVKEYKGQDANTGEYLYNIVREGKPLGYQPVNSGNRAIYMEGLINYDRVFNGTHAIGAMLLGSRREYLDFTTTDAIQGQPYRRQGLAGRITYAYNSKYLIEFNAGYNGSENFPIGKKYGFFPSMSIGWVPSNEDFWNFKPISHLKLRASIGQAGNDQIGGNRFLYMTTINETAPGMILGSNFQYYSGVSEAKIGTPNVTWETATKANIGLDVNLFKDALNIQIDAFYEYRNGILMQLQQIPDYVGYESTSIPYGNLGVVKNIGADAIVEYKEHFDNGFFYSLRGNFTFAQNKIIKNDEPTQKYGNLSKIGSSIDQPWGLVALGIFQNENEIQSSPKQEFMTTVLPGDIKYKDINGDNKINSDDAVAIGFPRTPEIVYGCGGTCGYKNFEISLYFTGAARTSIFIEGNSMYPFVEGLGIFNVLNEYYDNRYISSSDPTIIAQNLNAKYPAVSEARNPNNYIRSTIWQKDASYTRLKLAEVSYNIPKTITAKLGISSIRLFVNGMNLLTWDKVKVIDPESNDGTGSYPINKTFNTGFNITF